MNTLPFTNHDNSHVNFRGLVLHGNVGEIITKGDKQLNKQVNLIREKLSKTKEWDLHVEPLGKRSVSYFWTRKGEERPVMENWIKPYALKANKVRIASVNPEDTEVKNDLSVTLSYISQDEAQRTYNAMKRKSQNLVEELDIVADTTLQLEQAKHFNLHRTPLSERIARMLPTTEKFTYGMHPIEQPNKTIKVNADTLLETSTNISEQHKKLSLLEKVKRYIIH